MAVLVCLVIFLAMTVASQVGSLGALYCLCKDGVSDQALQKSLDNACGGGADCSAIRQSGACYQPNTVKSHCDFAGSATTSANPPTNVVNGCVYASSPSCCGNGATGETPSRDPKWLQSSPEAAVCRAIEALYCKLYRYHLHFQVPMRGKFHIITHKAPLMMAQHIFSHTKQPYEMVD